MEKCYANSIGNCSEKLSGEHIVSKGILDDQIEIMGFPWCKSQSMLMSKNSFVSNILCERHNSLLSPFDNEIKSHKNHIDLIDQNDKLFDRMPQMIKQNQFVYANNGYYLERWFLKTLINICKINKKHISLNIEILLPYLFDNALFEYPYGLGVLTKPGLSINSSNILHMCPILSLENNIDHVWGGIFRYRGFAYLLLLPPYKFTIEREKPIIDNIFSGQFKDLMGCQYNWHNEKIDFQRNKVSGRMVNAQSLRCKWF